MNVVAATRDDFAWLVERTQCGVTEGFRAIKAVDAEGRTRGMVGYDAWTENAVQAHMAVDSPMAWRTLLRPAFAYPFEECGLGLILAVIPADNAKSVRLAKHFGFQEVWKLRDGWAAGVDLMFLEMRRDDCRWLKE